MSEVKKEGKPEKRQRERASKTDALTGTTRRVYRYIYKRGPVRPNEIQRELRLSSSSQADYHIQKLLQMRLIREELTGDGASGYVAEEAVFEAMIRIKRMVIPLWTTVTTFFGGALVVLLTILRPTVLNGLYIFSLIITVVAVIISVYQAIASLGRDGI